MRTIITRLLLSSLLWAASACQDEHDDGAGVPSSMSPRSASHLVPQMLPPLDLKAPPDDSTKTAGGLALKKLATNEHGAHALRGDTVLVHYTGWRQSTGVTFFTTKAGGEPMALDVAHASPAFSEALQRLRQGERTMLWVPPTEAGVETLVYEVELLEVVSPRKHASKEPDARSASASAVRSD